MDFDLFCRIVDQFPKISELVLQGLGEPLLHPQLFEMVNYAADKGLRVVTTSNLTLLDRELARECVHSGLARINVSLDAATAELYERIRIGSSFERVLENLRILMEERQQVGTGLPEVRIVMVLMRQNLEEVPAVVRLASQFGVGEVFVQYLCHDFGEESLPLAYRPMREFVDRQMISNGMRDQVRDVYREARLVAASCGVDLRLPLAGLGQPRELRHGERRCDWPWSGMYFSYDGQAMPCCMIATPDRLSLGNATTQTVQEIWDSPGYHDFRRQLDSPEPPAICRSCSVYRRLF